MKYILLFLLLILSTFVYAQDIDSSLNSLKQQFENFQFTKVISSADSLLINKVNMSTGQLKEIYKVKAISEYSLLDEENAKISFIAILNLDSNFVFDSTKTSPKIISFFNDIKRKYISDLTKQKEIQEKQDKLNLTQNKNVFDNEKKLRSAIIRSILLPGLGHISNGEKTKGIILTTLSAASLGSMVYFIIDTNKKQDAYQSENDPNLIPSKYNDYNNSYKLRNASIITFAVIWLYSQIDLLFFTDFNKDQNLTSKKIPQINFNSLKGVQLSYQFYF